MTNVLPYEVLVVDDEQRAGSWGETTKIQLEMFEFKVDHVYTIEDAIESIEKKSYDIFMIDLFLQSAKSGIDLQR